MAIGRNVFVLVLLAMIAGRIGDAHADALHLDACTFHLPGDTVTDPHIADLLKRVESGGTVRSCPAGTRETWYYTLTPISKQSRVSYFHQTQMFPKESGDVIEWTLVPTKDLRWRLGSKPITTTLMCGEEFSCDRHYSTAYVETTGLSPGLFRKLQDTWNRISKSEVQFRHAAKGAPEDITQIPEFDIFRAYVFEKRLYDLAIWKVHFVQGGEYEVSVEDHGYKWPHFEFAIRGPRRKLWTFGYDYRGDGIRLLYLFGVNS